MFTITPHKLQRLRIDPSTISKNYADSVDLDNSLLTTLSFEEELFGDKFLVEQSRPNIDNVDYVEEVVAMINEDLKHDDSISVSRIQAIEAYCKSKFKLPSSFSIDGELEKYHQYLLLKSGKILIDADKYQLIKACSQKVKSILNVPSLAESQKCPLGLTSHRLRFKTDGLGKDIERFYYVNKSLYFQLRNSEIPDRAEVVIPVDYLVVNGKKASITNLFMVDKVIHFPDIYKEERLDLVAGLQKLCLESLGWTVDISFLVLEPKYSYTFTVENFPKTIDELNKAYYHIRNGSYRLPFEYEAERFKL